MDQTPDPRASKIPWRKYSLACTFSRENAELKYEISFVLYCFSIWFDKKALNFWTAACAHWLHLRYFQVQRKTVVSDLVLLLIW